MKISVAGHPGLLAQFHKVKAFFIPSDNAASINQKKSLIEDVEIERFLKVELDHFTVILDNQEVDAPIANQVVKELEGLSSKEYASDISGNN